MTTKEMKAALASSTATPIAAYGATVTVAEIYHAAKETCSRLYVACGGNPNEAWNVNPHPSTAAIKRNRNAWGHDSWDLFMPAMPLDARLSRREADTLIGYVTHELGHALFTDFACYDASVTLGLHNLVNGLEDIRCEAKLCAHGGSIGNARELLETLTEYTTLKALANGWNHLNPAALPFTLYSVGAIEVLGYSVPSMPALVFPEPLAGIVRETMARVRRAKNTSDVLAIAQWLMTALPAMPPMNPAPSPDTGEDATGGMPVPSQDAKPAPSDDKASEGDDDMTGAAGSGTDDDKASDDKASEGDDDTGTGATGEEDTGEEPSEKPAESVPAPAGDASASESEKPASDDASQSPEGKGGNDEWNPSDAKTQNPEVNLNDMGARVSERNGQDVKTVTAENKQVTDFLNATECKVVRRRNLRPDHHAAATLTGLIPTPAKLRRDVTRALRSPDLTSNARHESKGRFDMRDAARASAGAVNVFRRRSEDEGQAVAVSFLIDLSSSMNGSGIEAATALALHLGDAAKAVNVPFEVLGFCCPSQMPAGPTATVLVAKDFRDPWQEARPVVASMVNAPSGGTSQMPAIITACDRLRRKAGVTRRILLVLADGGDLWSAASNRAAVKAAGAKGVEVVMIGAGCSVAMYGTPHVDVRNLRTLATEGLGALADILRR